MARLLKIVLLGLTAFAVSVQGFAATTHFDCDVAHHRSSAARSQAITSDDHTSSVGLSQESDVDASVESPDRHSAVAHNAHLSKAHASPAKVGKGSCNSCGSCCVVGVTPVTPVLFQPVPQVEAFNPFVARRLASFLTTGLDRPPRFVLV